MSEKKKYVYLHNQYNNDFIAVLYITIKLYDCMFIVYKGKTK